METPATCLNCGQPVTTVYCGHCGQNNPPKKLNLKTLWFDFQSRVYGFDGMFPRTLRDLTLRPGAVARSYINGNRVLYYGPVGYLFIVITVYFLLASILNVDLSEFTLAGRGMDWIQQGEGQQAMRISINHWVIENMRLVSFAWSVWIVIFTWLFFRKSGYNLVESSVLIFFVNGHIYWLTIFAMIVYKFSGYAINSFLQIGLHFCYTLFALVNLYQYQTKIKVFLKAIVLIIVSYLSLIVLAAVLTVIYFMLHPDLLEQIRPSNNRIKTEQTK